MTEATKEALESRRGRRRFKVLDWSDVGQLKIPSATAGEWVKLDAARQRATMAAMAGKRKEHEAATQDFLLLCCYHAQDMQGNPFFSQADRDLILSLDSALTDELVSAVVEHCATADAGAAQKNLPATSSVATPSGSGST